MNSAAPSNAILAHGNALPIEMVGHIHFVSGGTISGNSVDDPRPVFDDMEQLLQQAQAGDRHAFEELFARHRSFLLRFIQLRLDPKLRTRIDPSDVVQETHLEAFGRLADFLERRPMPFRLWLRQTAYQRLIKLRRRHLGSARRAAGREVGLPDGSAMGLVEHILAAGSSPSRRLARQEQALRVEELLASLPEADREILVMRNLEGLDYAEISCVLGIDAAAARKRYGRALLRMRELLHDDGLLEGEP